METELGRLGSLKVVNKSPTGYVLENGTEIVDTFAEMFPLMEISPAYPFFSVPFTDCEPSISCRCSFCFFQRGDRHFKDEPYDAILVVFLEGLQSLLRNRQSPILRHSSEESLFVP